LIRAGLVALSGGVRLQPSDKLHVECTNTGMIRARVKREEKMQHLHVLLCLFVLFFIYKIKKRGKTFYLFWKKT
jgi:Na+/H+ antiporter NhaB